MKPQTMLEFVLSQCDIGMEIQSLQHQIRDRANRFHKIENYAKFLAQQPELWMFLPCDSDGNVLEYPKYEAFQDGQKRDDLVAEYQKALDRVIFDGFTFRNKKEFEIDYTRFSLSEFDTIEQLINEVGHFLTLKKPIL